MTIWPQKNRNTTKNEAAPWRRLIGIFKVSFLLAT